MTDSALKWFVVRTNPRCEERAVESLKAEGIRVYCPMQLLEKRQGKQRKRVEVERPLFVRYIFVGLRNVFTPFGVVRKCDGVKEFVGVQGEPMQVPWKSIEVLQVGEDMGLFDFRESKQAICLEVGEGVVLVSAMSDNLEASVERVPKTKDQPILLSINGKKILAPLDQIRKLA